MIHLTAALIVLFFTPVLLWFFWDHFGFGKWGLVLAYLGDLSNMLAVAANGIHMPVIGYYLPPGLLWVSGKGAHLPWLCDRFLLGNNIYSVGDFIIGSGILVAVAGIVTHIIRRISKCTRT